jgi:Skp family chaperone for outer membrane proteins
VRYILRIATVTLVLVGSALAQERAARPLLVGVVDIGRVFKTYTRKDELEKAINDKRNLLVKEAEQQDADLRALGAKAPPESDKAAVAKFTADVEAARARIKTRRDEMESELKEEVEQLTLSILHDVDDAVASFGKKNGYAFILKKDSKGWTDERFQERIFRAQVTVVVYHAPALEVTDEIVRELNAKKR